MLKFKKNKSYSQKTVELNSQSVANEFNSYNNSIIRSNDYFGLNLFDFYTQEQCKSLVKDPMTNNELLREISLMLYGTNGIYTNTVDYTKAMPTLDKVVVSHGNNRNKKKHNKELMLYVLRKIKDKEIIRDALFKGMIDGVYFAYFETISRPKSNKKVLTDFDVNNIVEINEMGINASIITLPVDYTKIVGIKNSSYVIAFNLDYFTLNDNESIETKLRRFPKEIRDAYYNKNDSNGNWIILDNTKTIVHKIRSKREEPWGRPIVLSAIDDILYGDYFVDTKRNVLDDINNRIIYETFPEGATKGISALTKKQQEEQHNAVKEAVLSKDSRGSTSFFSVSAGTKLDKIETSNTDIFDDKYESNLNDKVALDMGIAGSLLNGVGSGSYSSQIQNLELITAQTFEWIEQIQEELNKCISKNIIKDDINWVEVRYLPITHTNKEKMVGYAKDLYLQGKGSLSLWASACGIPSDVFFTMLDEELELDIENKYPVHKTSFTMSGDEESAGRPETDNPSENTIKSRSNDGNSLPSPSDKKRYK